MKLKFTKNLSVFFIFFAISTVLWFLNALEKEYTTTINLPVSFVNIPKGKINVKPLPEFLKLGIKGYGYDIMKFQLKKQIRSIKIDLAKIELRALENNDTSNFFVLSKDLKNQIDVQLSSPLSIEDIMPDTIFFFLTRVRSKQVIVKPSVSVQLKKQYTLKRPPYAKPDTVTVSAPENILDTLEYLITEHITFYEADKTDSQKVKIKTPPTSEVKPQYTTVFVEVEEYTEKILTVPIKVKNLPDTLNIVLFPDKVTINCKVGLKEYDRIQPSDFEIIIDYSKIKENLSEKLPLEVIAEPDSIYGYTMKPHFVEYIIETKK